MSPVRYDAEGAVATVTLADHENRNALGSSLVAGIHDGMTRALADDAVRVIVLTHESSIFCAGANLKERSTADSAGTAGGVPFESLLTQIMTAPKPVVARIAGAAMGGGLGLAAAADISIAGAAARFGFTEVRLGVAPAIISVVCLPKMRRGDAMEAFLRGNRFEASEAARLGLISRAVPDDELDGTVERVVDDLRRGGPSALAAAKRLVNDVPSMTREAAFAWTSELSAQLFRGDEAQAGMRAFLDRSDPPWFDGST